MFESSWEILCYLLKPITLKSLNNITDVLGEPIGTSNPMSEYAPAWHIQAMKGELKFLENS